MEAIKELVKQGLGTGGPAHPNGSRGPNSTAGP
jgi:hypothetical protein